MMTDFTRPKPNDGPKSWMQSLDALLRGEATNATALKRGAINVAPDGMLLLILALGALYGGCMGSYALFKPTGSAPLQFLVAAGKVPLLFLLTLLVTFPSLYVFNALVGSRLRISSVFRLIVAAMAVMLSVLASFGPIVAFFGASTTSYSFMLLLNVAAFATAGFLGLRFLLATLHKLSLSAVEEDEADEKARQSEAETPELAQMQLPPPPAPYPQPSYPAPIRQTRAQMHQADVTRVFRIWIVVFGLVGAQMSWVLRPFLGAPGRDFVLFSPRESNFFEAVFQTVLRLLGGG